jgi:hypothetical protein
MEAAALVLLVAGVGGVDFGWQPMPDGSPRYEYLVQIEPEMLESLAEGRAIPIAGDAPDEVHPIARVRVTVGRGALPRQLLATHRKPVDAGAPADSGVTLTQYTEGVGTPRYSTPPPAFDAYTQAPPAAGSGGAGWNGGDAGASGGGATGGNWNAGGAVAEAADSMAERVNDGFQQATAPLQEGINQFGDQIRSAAGDLGDRTNQMLDDLGLPPRRASVPGAAGSGAAPLSTTSPLAPGGTWNAGAGDGVQGYPGNEGMRNLPAAATASSPPVTPTNVPDSSFGSSWNMGAGDPSAPSPTLADSYRNTGAGTAVGAAAGKGGGLTAPPLVTGAGGGRGAMVADPWENATDPRFRTAQQGTAAGGGFGAASGGGFAGAPGGTAIPGFTNTSTGGAAGAGPTLGDPSGAAGPPRVVGAPQVDAGMLSLPGDRPLDGVADAASATAPGQLGGGLSGSGSGNLGGSVFSPATAGPPNPSGTTSGSDLLNSQGWGANQLPASSQAAADAASKTSGEQNRLLVLVAWVLLFASIAGNLYLFWSYLDVRTKYRALVRKTARAVGSRFSPA